ncbi:MAG: FAD-dependent oxidoreductase [Saprospiraceae bacterium]|nr:FAD-dependent oxidoreductase [Saprospiraceae bacterium]
MEDIYDVIIIGAGISGLTAANLLAQRPGVSFKILEASSKIGGRVRSVQGFSDFPIELGAEEIHGENTLLYKILKGMNIAFVQEEEEDYVWWRYQLLSQKRFDELEDARAVYDLEEVIPHYHGDDMTMKEFIVWHGVPYRVHHLINAHYGSEHGTSIDQVDMRALRKHWHKWDAGEENFMLKGSSLQGIVEHHFAFVLGKIQVRTPIELIDTRGDYIRLIDAHGESYKCQSVIVTVPLPILQKKILSFVPELPNNYQEAIDNLRMGKGLKVVLKFKNRFWPEKMGSVYGTGRVNEFWSTGFGRSQKNNLLTAYCMGKDAEELGAMPSEKMIETILKELDLIFGNAVASQEYVDAFWTDWTREPFILGSYSYPSKNNDQYRRVLSRPLNDLIFFAGEATNTIGHYGTMHGAMESAIRAVEDWEETHLLGKGKSDG